MRLPRLTVRRWMVAMVVVALALAGEVTRRRWVEFAMRASSHAQAAEFERFILDEGVAFVGSPDGQVTEIHGPQKTREDSADGGWIITRRDPSPGYDAESIRRRVEYHARLRAKYERAARRPWLPVAPDPPRPR